MVMIKHMNKCGAAGSQNPYFQFWGFYLSKAVLLVMQVDILGLEISDLPRWKE